MVTFDHRARFVLSTVRRKTGQKHGFQPDQVDAAEIRLIAEGFLDQKDRQVLLQYADEIEFLALEFETKERDVALPSQASA